MKACLVGVAIVVGMTSAAFAQAPSPGADPVKARQKISMMESVLESAVANGADSLMRAVRVVMPLSWTRAPSPAYPTSFFGSTKRPMSPIAA